MHPPPSGTVERWAWDYVLATALTAKITPPAVPDRWETGAPVRRIEAPGRPPELVVLERARKTRGLNSRLGRARALHTFWHHELQAAELMAWALLAFADAPQAFRSGLLRLALDEVRHMSMYSAQIERLGHRVGDFPVRDWFWARVPACADPAAFVAVMGLGLESANLDHSDEFAARFREAGDDEGARVQEIIGGEEIGHVRFGVEWFSYFRGPLTFEAWRASLPKPLSPMLMRGMPIHRSARERAGQPVRFINELEAWTPAPLGS
ncbi:MAG: ferritin-like domain-containing protein [Polyangiaceae bacterium]|nr:ferritin-like domain-containing protein [Polyangiaceae bacterium]